MFFKVSACSAPCTFVTSVFRSFSPTSPLLLSGILLTLFYCFIVFAFSFAAVVAGEKTEVSDFDAS